MRIRFTAVLVLLALVCPLSVGAGDCDEMSIELKPAYLDLGTVEPGSIYSSALRLERGCANEEQVLEVGAEFGEISDWLVIDSARGIIAGQGIDIPFSLDVPRDAGAGDRSGYLLVRLLPADIIGSALNISIAARFQLDFRVASSSLPPVVVEVEDAPKNELFDRLKGRMVLRTEASGEAYYLDPGSSRIEYLGRPHDAFDIMRGSGVGISNADLEKIPVGFLALSGADTDSDSLTNALEDALGTNKYKADTDGDGRNDKSDIMYSQSGLTGIPGVSGRILLQVENHGEAWYVNPEDSKRYFLGRPNDAFQVMRYLSIGISESDFYRLEDNR